MVAENVALRARVPKSVATDDRKRIILTDAEFERFVAYADVSPALHINGAGRARFRWHADERSPCLVLGAPRPGDKTRVNFDSLRRAFNTALADAGVNVQTAMPWRGIAIFRVTLRRPTCGTCFWQSASRPPRQPFRSSGQVACPIAYRPNCYLTRI